MQVRERPRLAALAAFVLSLLLWPTFARAGSPSTPPACEAIEGMEEFERAERERLLSACRRGKLDKEAIVESALLLGDWRSAFFLRHIQPPKDPGTGYRAPESLFETMLDAPKCSALRERIEAYLRGESKVPHLDADPKCLKTHDPGPERVLAGYKLFTYAGDADQFALWAISLDADAAAVESIPVIPHDFDGRTASFALVPEGISVVIEIKPSDADTGRVYAKHHVERDWEWRPEGFECVEVSFITDDAQERPAVVVDGSRHAFEPHDAAQAGQGDDARKVWRRVFRVPKARQHDVSIVLEGEADPWYTRRRSLGVPEDGTCRELHFDLTGLEWAARYGLAGVTVDEQCRQEGILPDRLRGYSERYVEGIGGELVHLDAWADIIADFGELGRRLEAGELQRGRFQLEGPREAPTGRQRDRLDDREAMRDIARELTAEGVNALLYLDLVCPSSGVEVSGKTIDLNRYVTRSTSQVMEGDTDVMRMRSHHTGAATLREAMEVVLGEIILDVQRQRPGYVRIVGVPREVRRGISTLVRVETKEPPITPSELGPAYDRGRRIRHASALDARLRRDSGRGESAPGLQVWVHRMRKDESDAGMCDRVGQVNTLADLSSPAEVTKPDGFSSLPLFTYEQSPSTSVQLGGLAAGTYALLAIYGDRSAAMCFSVSEQDLEGFVSIGGFRQRRGVIARNNPRLDNFSFVRVIGGARYTFGQMLELGPEFGYEWTSYESETPPSWEGADLEQGALRWQRHGIVTGGFVGMRIPWSACSYPPNINAGWLQQHCRTGMASMALFVDVHILANVGFINLREIPEQPRWINGDVDLDIAATGGFRYKPRKTVVLGVFGGVLLTDVLRSRNLDLAGSYEYDWSLRGIFGIEMSFGGDTGVQR